MTLGRGDRLGADAGDRARRCCSACYLVRRIRAGGRPRPRTCCTTSSRPSWRRPPCRSRARSRPARRSASSRSRGIGVDQVFVEGSASEQTIDRPGPEATTPCCPGQTGVSVLVGRRATFGARSATSTSSGPVTGSWSPPGRARSPTSSTWCARATRRRADRVGAGPAHPGHLDPASRTEPHACMVSAELDGEPAAAPAPAPTVPASTSPARAAPAGLVALLLWPSSLLLVTVARHLGGPRGSAPPGLWIGALPVLLAILWNVFEHARRPAPEHPLTTRRRPLKADHDATRRLPRPDPHPARRAPTPAPLRRRPWWPRRSAPGSATTTCSAT